MGHTWFAVASDLSSWIAGKLIPELISGINNRRNEMTVGDRFTNQPSQDDWHGGLNGGQRQVRPSDLMAVIAPESYERCFASFDIAVPRQAKTRGRMAIRAAPSH
jgi:hypothetical protein